YTVPHHNRRPRQPGPRPDPLHLARRSPAAPQRPHRRSRHLPARPHHTRTGNPRMRTALQLPLALATAVAITGCGITEGTISNRDHDNGYYQTRCHTVVVAPARGTTPARTRQDCRQEWVHQDRWSFEDRKSAV